MPAQLAVEVDPKQFDRLGRLDNVAVTEAEMAARLRECFAGEKGGRDAAPQEPRYLVFCWAEFRIVGAAPLIDPALAVHHPVDLGMSLWKRVSNCYQGVVIDKDYALLAAVIRTAVSVSKDM
jgi:hypothetical protein